MCLSSNVIRTGSMGSTGSSACHTLTEQQGGRSCDTFPSHTLRVKECVAEGAAQCSDSVVHGAGWQIYYHPAHSHQLHCIQGASQHRAGMFNETVLSLLDSMLQQISPQWMADTATRPKTVLKNAACTTPVQSLPFLYSASVLLVPSSLFLKWTPGYLCEATMWVGHGCTGTYPPQLPGFSLVPLLIWRRSHWHQSTNSCVMCDRGIRDSLQRADNHHGVKSGRKCTMYQNILDT